MGSGWASRHGDAISSAIGCHPRENAAQQHAAGVSDWRHGKRITVQKSVWLPTAAPRAIAQLAPMDQPPSSAMPVPAWSALRLSIMAVPASHVREAYRWYAENGVPRGDSSLNASLGRKSGRQSSSGNAASDRGTPSCALRYARGIDLGLAVQARINDAFSC